MQRLLQILEDLHEAGLKGRHYKQQLTNISEALTK